MGGRSTAGSTKSDDGKREISEQPVTATDNVETVGESRTRERMNVVAESVRDRKSVGVDVSLDTLDSRTKDPETPRLITDINFYESAEVQRKKLDRLELVSVFVVAAIIHANQETDTETLKQFDAMGSLRRLFANTQKPGNRYESENAAIAKLEQLKNHAESDVATDFIPKWPSIVEKAIAIEQSMRALKNADLRKTSSAEEEQEKGGIWDSSVKFFKKHPIACSIGLLAGAYGIYKLFFGKSSDTSPAVAGGTKERSGVLGWTIGIIATIGGLFGLGRLLGVEGLKTFLKEKLDWDVDSSRATKALQLVAQGKIKEAREVLWEGVDNNAEFHAKMAEHITKDMKSKVKVSGKTLFEESNEDFDTYINGLGQTVDDISNWFGKYLGASSLPGVDSKRKNDEQTVLRTYLKKNENRVKEIMKKNNKEGEEITVEEALQALYKEAQNPEAEPDEPENVDTIVETDEGKAGVGIDVAKVAELRGVSKGKEFQAFVDKYDGHWEDAVKSPGVFLNDLFSACRKSDIPVILAEGSIFLMKADKAILISTTNVLWETAVALVAAPFSDKVGWSDVIGTYVSGAKTLVVIGTVGGAALGAIKGVFSESGVWGGLIKGGGKGFKSGLLFPIEIPRLHVAAGQRIYRAARGGQYFVRRVFSAAEMAPQILAEQARFHAEIAQSYDRLIGAAEGSIHRRNWWGWYTKDRAIALRQRHLVKFREVNNDLRAMQIKLKVPKSSWVPDFPQAKLGGESRMDPVNEFLNRDQPAIAVAKPIDIKGVLFRKTDGSARTVAEAKEIAKRLRTEIADPAITDPAIKAAKQKELSALEAFISPAKAKSFTVSGKDFENLDDAARAEKVLKVASEMEAAEKGVQARFNMEVEKIVADAKLKKLPLTDPTVTAKLESLDSSITIPFGKQKQASIKALTEAYKKVPKAKRTPLLRTQVAHAREGVDGSIMTRIAKGVGGRAKMMVVMASLIFATDQIIHRNDAERDLDTIMRELGPDMGQLLLDVLPFAGTYSNYHSAFSGREIVSKRDVSGVWDRASNVIWGTVGLAGDIFTVLSALPSGGLSLGANATLRLAKAARGGSKTAAKLLKMWPRITVIAERMGGWRKFAQKVRKYMGGETKGLKVLRKIQSTGAVAGTALLAGGLSYNLYYAFADDSTEIELPPDLQTNEPPQKTPIRIATDPTITGTPEAPPETSEGARAAA